MPGGFVHLDVRSFFSLKEGAFSPEALARRAAQLHLPAVALADRDGLYGTARFVDACEREGVRPILGATLTVREAGTLPLPRGVRGAQGASADARAVVPPRKGWVSLYAVAFALMLVAAIALMASSLGSLRSIGLLWISSGLSLLSAGLAVASVLVPRRG